MWTRAELKTNAKQVLRRSYWLALGVSMIYSVLAERALSGMFNGKQYTQLSSDILLGRSAEQEQLAGMLDFGPVVTLLFVFSLLIYVLAVLPMQVGLCRFFMGNRMETTDFGPLIWGFRNGRYGKCVGMMLLMQVKLLLWSALLIVPGIIKAYEYAMVPYLLAENPEREAAWYFKTSRSMMNGEKWQYFVLNLSFLGWLLLGLVALCIGILFVQPYCYATYAEFYALMRAKAFATGIAGQDELCGFGRQSRYQ